MVSCRNTKHPLNMSEYSHRVYVNVKSNLNNIIIIIGVNTVNNSS